MKQELCDVLHSKYPKLFDGCVSISCGNDWFNLIDALCGTVQFLLDQGITEQEKIIDIKSKFWHLDIFLTGNTKPFLPLLMLAAKVSRSIKES